MGALEALNRVAKWRALFAGWQLGTRAKGDPECDAVRDHREVSIVMRVELNALLDLLYKKGIVTTTEYEAALEREANHLSKQYEQKFPGVHAHDDGLHMDPAKIQAWMRTWKP